MKKRNMLEEYIKHYEKAVIRRDKAGILDRKYWRERVIFLHKLIQQIKHSK